MTIIHYIGIILLPLNALFFTQNFFAQSIQIIIAVALIFHEFDEHKNGKLLSKELIEFLKNMDNPNYVLNINTSMASEYSEIKKVIDQREKIRKIKKQEENTLIQESKKIMNLVKKGSFENTINTQTSNQALEEFKTAVNDMIRTTKNNFSIMNSILLKYKNYDYKNDLKLDNINQTSELDILVASINNLKEAIRTMVLKNKDNGNTLHTSAMILLNNVDSLNNSSFEAVESLENTSTVLSEITHNVENTSQKTHQMSTLSTEVIHSVNQGEALALRTSQSMDQINEKVFSINDAITVIDQIAFQTNILSLNAAVEAATAGESGKGFAVVAQEVRNLANKSAEAAKDIKNLVELAKYKADEGKDISDDMIQGYTSLNDNINKTITLITDVSNTSIEQKKAIVKINDSVGILNTQINRNKEVTTKTHDIAIKTSEIANTIVKDANEKQL